MMLSSIRTGLFQRLGHRIAVSTSSDGTRNFSKSSVRQLKEIKKTTSADGKTLTIEGVYVTSPREDKLVEKLKPADSARREQGGQEPALKKCPLCRLGLEIKHTDVLILQQFLDPNGVLLQRHITGLCRKQQKRVDYLVQMAKYAGILNMPCDPDPKQRPGWLKYNIYYDETVIDEFLRKTRNKA